MTTRPRSAAGCQRSRAGSAPHSLPGSPNKRRSKQSARTPYTMAPSSGVLPTRRQSAFSTSGSVGCNGLPNKIQLCDRGERRETARPWEEDRLMTPTRDRESQDKDPRDHSPFVPHGHMPDPFTLVIFGATADLAARKLFPAVFTLTRRHCLPAA